MDVRATVRGLPGAQNVWAFLKLFQGRTARFARDYTENSGAGSTLETTRAVVEQLPALLRSLGVRSLLDVPCGDFLWMQRVNLDGIAYTGGDIIDQRIALNQIHASPTRSFRVLDITADVLPTADLVLVRDCFVHLSNRLVKQAIANIKRSGSTYLLTTTFPAKANNADIVTGNWRPIQLCAAPFHFPPPLQLLSERHPEPHPDKSLGLWRVSDLP